MKNIVEIENTVISFLFTNEEVSEKISQEISADWFTDIDNKTIVKNYLGFSAEFNRSPTILELRTKLLKETEALGHLDKIVEITTGLNKNSEFLIKKVEEFAKNQMYMNLANKISKNAINFEPHGDYTENLGAIEGFTFDHHQGVSLTDDLDYLYDKIIENENVFPTGLASLDNLIGGGFPEKTLTLLLAPTNVGKTMVMCSLACNFAMNNFNVLYISLEDSEVKISQRIYQNLLNVSRTQLKTWKKEAFKSSVEKNIIKKVSSKIRIKEMPEQATNPMMIRNLLKDYEKKEHFLPDVVFVDYIGCMIPNGKTNENMNTNTIITNIASQVRAIGVERCIPIISASQTNRGGFDLQEINMNNTADSFGQNTKADIVFGLVQTKELKESDLITLSLLKTRVDGEQKGKSISLGVDISKQRVYDVNQDATNASNNTAFDYTNKDFISDEPYKYDEDNYNTDLDDIE